MYETELNSMETLKRQYYNNNIIPLKKQVKYAYLQNMLTKKKLNHVAEKPLSSLDLFKSTTVYRGIY